VWINRKSAAGKRILNVLNSRSWRHVTHSVAAGPVSHRSDSHTDSVIFMNLDHTEKSSSHRSNSERVACSSRMVHGGDSEHESMPAALENHTGRPN
jgi:hypothetical protein